MPCYTSNTAEIDLSKANAEVLKTALEKLGFKVYGLKNMINASGNFGRTNIQWKAGSPAVISTAGSTDELTKEIKRAYSSAAVEYAAKRNGWQIKQTAANKYEVIRR